MFQGNWQIRLLLCIIFIVFRQYAKMLVKEGEECAYLEAIKNEYLEEKDKMNGSEEHYNFFESLISGRDPNSDQSIGENFRRIFPAQVLKDCVMASMVRREIQKSDPQDKVRVCTYLLQLITTLSSFL